MKHLQWIVMGAAALFTFGCQSFPADRIAAHQADFNSWPPEVLASVRAGRIALGYTQEQVLVALGEPTQKTQAGDPASLSEVWAYDKQAPRFGFGIGGADIGSHSAVAGGISANGMKLGLDEFGHVLFHNGRVADFSMVVR